MNMNTQPPAPPRQRSGPISPHTENQTWMQGNSPISLGRFSYGYEYVTVRQWGEGRALTIGSFCSISSSVMIFLGGNHRPDWISTFPFGHILPEVLDVPKTEGHPGTHGDVHIGHDVWIGHGVTIMSGVNIGDGAVLAANSTIVRDVQPYEIAGGNPAKPIKKRFSDELIGLLLELRWWDLPLEAIREIGSALSAPPTADLLHALLRKYRPTGS